MKTISLKALAAMLTCTLFLTVGCKDDDSATPDKTKLLTGGSWQLTAMTVDPAVDWFGTPVKDVYSKLPACLKDDLTTFKSNGVLISDEGPTKCDPSDPQTQTGTWAFNDKQTILSITTDGETERWDVSSLTSTTFKGKYTQVEDGVTYTFTVTFGKKS